MSLTWNFKPDSLLNLRKFKRGGKIKADHQNILFLPHTSSLHVLKWSMLSEWGLSFNFWSCGSEKNTNLFSQCWLYLHLSWVQQVEIYSANCLVYLFLIKELLKYTLFEWLNRFMNAWRLCCIWKLGMGFHLKVLVNYLVSPSPGKIGIWMSIVRTDLIIVPWTWITLKQALQHGSCLTYTLSVPTGTGSEQLTKMETKPNFTGLLCFYEWEEIAESKIRQILLFRIFILNFCFYSHFKTHV